MAIRPSFTTLLTLKIDDRAVILPDNIRKSVEGAPKIISSKHSGMLRILFPGNLVVSRRNQPIQVDIEKNSHMTADRCTAVYAWERLKVDPRCVRGGLIQVFAGTVSHQDYADGITELDGNSLKVPKSIVTATEDKSIFVGMFDRMAVKWTENSRLVSVDARDFTQHMIDRKVPVSVLKDLPDFSLKLDQWVRELLKTNEDLDYILDVEIDGASSMPKAIDTVAIKKAQEKVKGKKRTVYKLNRSMGNISYWDLIVDVCVGAGIIPNVKLDKIVLSEARTFYGPETYDNSRFRRVFGGKKSSVRRFIYGEDIAAFELTKNMNPEQTSHVRVISSNHGNPISVIYPPLKIEKDKKGNKKGKSPKIRIVLFNSTKDKKVLKRVARLYWEQAARQEYKGSIVTHSVASNMGDGNADPNDDPDLLWLEVADPIRFAIKEVEEAELFGVHDPVVRAVNSSAEDIARSLMNEDLVSGSSLPFESYLVIAKGLKSTSIQPFFRVRDIKHSFSTTGNQGYKCTINFHNFFEAVWNESDRQKFSPFSSGESTR